MNSACGYYQPALIDTSGVRTTSSQHLTVINVPYQKVNREQDRLVDVVVEARVASGATNIWTNGGHYQRKTMFIECCLNIVLYVYVSYFMSYGLFICEYYAFTNMIFSLR